MGTTAEAGVCIGGNIFIATPVSRVGPAQFARQPVQAGIQPAGAKSGLTAQNRSRRKDVAGWLRGMVSFVSMVNPKQGGPLRERLAKAVQTGGTSSNVKPA
jgi:hypothetical protein